MFERFTEKARRAIFFARYEASQYGSPHIDIEHLLLGLVREDKKLYSWIPRAQPPELIRQRIEGWIKKRPLIATSVDLPLSQACKNVLLRGQDEADRLNSKYIGTAHLFLGLLQEPNCPTTKLLQELGAEPNQLRIEFSKMPEAQASSVNDLPRAQRAPSISGETITIHGERRLLLFVLGIVTHYRQQKWYWRKESWKPRDAVIERKTGRISLDLNLAEDAEHFELVKDGWKQDYCAICHWKLYESKDDAEHGTGYTNGRDLVCNECYDNFRQRPDFIAGSFSDIT